MKKHYLLMLVIAFFSFNLAQAQFCPPTGFANPNTLYFIYDAGTSDCADRPSTVVVEGSTFTQSSCSDELSIYNLTSGPDLVDPTNIAVDFGFAICNYSGGTLSAEQFEMIFNETLRVFPNPVNQGNNINIALGVNTNVKVNIYDVTGKQMLSTDTSNSNNVSVDISSLENGIYIAQIVTDLATITRKVIVMK